ncbi:ABC transporter ATP-binding protein [Peptoniphilus sp. oral taxon 386]|uniref:ABC transporter ATP-binding protein n=1 Tax=Peptoniphilus sp. oral taxon 386 TaxID=652713 RepID=UPI0001DA9A03|nr:ABC transporter ATP-binding protein [Peptoniphilus sp. oral taxon 386]EFI41821.1 ABC transporter, ATP-binding protein [Peptoniphilus sp. oral taxon 386 str. F0131]
MKAVEIKNLSKSYGDFSLKDVNFDVEKGSIMGLIGANGAGKTTIIKAILSMIKYGGDIKIFGKKLDDDIRQDIGFVLEDCFISNFLSAKEADKVFKNMYKNWDSDYYNNLLNKFELPLNKSNSKFSKGMRMKFKIAVALSSHPKLLILDEPTSGLDPVIRDEILDIFLGYIEDENNSILISSHITSDLEKIADYITYIDKGEIVFSKEKYDLFEDMGILKCSNERFKEIDKSYIQKYKIGKYSVEALIKNKDMFKKEYSNEIVDSAELDEIMVFYAKGEDI